MSGALAGFALGVAASPVRERVVGDDGRWAVVGLVALALAADLVWLRTGRLRPLAWWRQVAREWGALLPAESVALVYGAQLGIGPVTMLNTWTWWAALLGGAVLGVWPAVLVGGLFGLVRILTTVGLAAWSTDDHPGRFGRFRDVDRPGRQALVLAAAVGAALTVAACTPDDPELVAEPTTSSPSAPSSPADDAESEEPPTVTEPAPTRITTDAEEPPTTPEPADSSTTTEATTTTPLSTAADAEVPVVQGIGAELLTEVPGYAPVDRPEADRALDLEAAAAIQPDPTEERPLLETRGFAEGWTRAFRNDTNDVIVTTVYRFADATEAAFYLEDGMITIGGYGGQFFDVEDIGGRGFRQELGGDEPLVSIGVSFTEGDRWFLVYEIGSPETVDGEDVIAAARAQAALARS